MANKKTRLAVVSAVAVLLVVALVLSLTAVMGANNNVYLGSDGNLNVSNAAVNTFSGENGVAKDGTLAQKGTGTTTGYTEIGGENGKDFSYVKANPGGNYILMGNITLKDVDTATTFTGILDGNGYTITLDITARSTSSDYVGGLFAYLSGGTVKNLTVAANTFIVGTGLQVANCGVMFGQINGGTVDNVCVELNHSPAQADDNDNNDSYFFTNYEADSGCITRLGAIAGVSVGTVLIQDTTVENNATGSYGFVTRTRTKAGSKNWIGITSYSYSDVMLGGFIGMAGADGDGNSTSLTFNRVTLAGSVDSQMTTHSASTDTYRKNRGMLGGFIGYNNQGTAAFNNVIVSYPVKLNTNVKPSANINNSNYGGVIIGWDDDSDASFTMNNLYFVDGAAVTYLTGVNNAASGVTVFPTTANPRFDGESNIAFYGLKKVAPNSSELVAYIEQAGQKQYVMTSLMLQEGESEETVWLSVPVVAHSADGTDHTLNLSSQMAGHGSVKLESDKLTMTGDNGSAYTATKYYDYQNVQSPTVAIYNKDAQKVGAIEGVYTCANSIDANATHTATPDIDAALAGSEYSSIVYGGVTYIYSDSAAYVYSPQNGIQTGGAIDLDLEKNIEVQVLPAPLTIDADFGANEVTYYDSYDDIIGKIQIKALSGQYYASAWITEYAITVDGGEYVQGMPVGTSVNIKIGAISFSDGDGNYDVTYGDGVDKIIQTLVLNGPFYGIGNIEYDGQNHMDAVYGNGKYPFEFVYEYTDAEGQPVEEVVNAGEYIVSVSYENDNVVLTDTTKNFTVAPKTVEILKKDVAFNHDYNRGVLNAADLFEVPLDIEGNPLTLNYKTTLGGEEAFIQHAGTYTITVSLAQYDNYTAADAVESYTVNKAVLEIGVEQDEAKLSSVYDNEAMTQEEMEALFTAPSYLGQIFPIQVNCAEQIVNSGVYTVTADAVILTEEQNDFECAQVSVQFTVEQATLDGAIVLPENKVFDGNLKTATFELSDGVLYGEDKVSVVYSQDGMSVESVVNAGEYTVTAVLPEFADGKSNYKWADGFNADATLVVEKKQVSVTALDGSEKTYDGVAIDGYASYFVLPEDIDGATLNYDYTIQKDGAAVGEIKDAGEYTLTANLAQGQDNYVSDTASVVITINKVQVDGALVLDDMKYDGSEKTARFVFAGESPMVGGDEIIIEYGEGDRTNYGSTVTVNAKVPSSNYVFADTAVTQGEITVERITVDGTLVFSDMKYDGKEKTAEFVFGGDSSMVGSDEIVVVYGDESDRINVGAPVSVTATLPSDNYVFADTAVTTGVIEVTPVEFVIDFGQSGNSADGLTVIVGQEFVFDAKIEGTSDNNVQIGDNSYTYSVSNNGWVDGDYTTAANVGEVFTLSVTLTIDGVDAGNYVYQDNIQVRVIATSMGGTLVADNDGAVYDGSAYGATLTGTVEGVEESDYRIEYALEGSDEWTAEKPVNAGVYSVRVVSLTDNYSADQIAQITFTIEKAQAAVTPVVQEGTYYAGHALPEISLGEGSTDGVISWTDGEAKLVEGTNKYAWTFVSSDPNYKDASGETEITASAVTFVDITVEKNEFFKANYVYGDEFFKDGVTVKANYSDGTYVVLSADEYTASTLLTGMTSVEITYTAQSASATVDGITVDKKTVEIPVVEGQFVYNGQVQSSGLTHTSLYTVSGDATAVSAGDHTVTLTLADVDNYKWADSQETSVTVEWTIAKKDASITADAQTITYGETVEPFSAQVSGTVNNERLEYIVGVKNAPSVYGKGEYDIEVELIPNSEINANYNVSVTNAILVVNAKKIEKPQVDSEQTFTYDGSEKTFVIPQGEDYTVSGNTAVDANAYSAVIALADKDNTTWSDDTTDDLVYEWSVDKATRELSATATLGYKYVAVSADNLGEVEYSLDNKTYSALVDGKAAVEISLNYTVYLRYKETGNYYASEAVVVELKLTKAIVAEYIDDSFGEEFTFADIDRYNAVKTLAAAAEGTSEDCDKAIAELDAKYNALIEGAKESAEEALGAGATLAGRKIAAAVVLSLTGAGVGIAVAALCVKARKGGKKDEE